MKLEMSDDEDDAMEYRLAKELRAECLQIFGSTWNLDNAHRLARVAIEEMKRASREPA